MSTNQTQKTTWILGLSAYYHDSAACRVKESQIVAAVQEERFTPIHHLPARRTTSCDGRIGTQGGGESV